MLIVQQCMSEQRRANKHKNNKGELTEGKKERSKR